MSELEVIYTGELITRREAKLLGHKSYFTGKPCKKGHISKRRLCSGSCCECTRLTTKAWRENSKDKGSCAVYNFKETPSVDDLLTWLRYDPVTGDIFWIERDIKAFADKRAGKSWNTRHAGKVAGAKHYINGYIEIRLPNRELHKAQRLAWKMYYREEPVGIVDHKNGLPWDNSVTNLRLATHQDNSRNMSSVGNSIYKGVCEVSEGVYQATCCINDKNKSKSGFVTAELAARWYDEQVHEVYGEFAKLNFPENYIKEEEK